MATRKGLPQLGERRCAPATGMCSLKPSFLKYTELEPGTVRCPPWAGQMASGKHRPQEKTTSFCWAPFSPLLTQVVGTSQKGPVTNLYVLSYTVISFNFRYFLAGPFPLYIKRCQPFGLCMPQVKNSRKRIVGEVKREGWLLCASNSLSLSLFLFISHVFHFCPCPQHMEFRLFVHRFWRSLIRFHKKSSATV